MLQMTAFFALFVLFLLCFFSWLENQCLKVFYNETGSTVLNVLSHRKLKLEENVANIWPDFGTNRKDSIKVHHVLNHTSGLHNAMADIIKENPLLICDWEESLNHIAMLAPETEPGCDQLYHYLSFGWLCGGIIEHASGKKFQEVLEESIIHPLNIEGELYIGIPPGVESRLATLTLDTDDLNKLSEYNDRPYMPSTLQPSNLLSRASALPALFNTLNIRRAIIPAANGHCSARALARYYAALAAGGLVPPPHTSSSTPLGSHPHIPKFPSLKTNKKKGGDNKSKGARIPKNPQNGNIDRLTNHSNTDTHTSNTNVDGNTHIIENSSNDNNKNKSVDKIYSNPRIHDAFMGTGDYRELVIPNGKFGLGFRRFESSGQLTSFGHSGLGGSTGFCDVEHGFAIAVTVNKMSLGGVTRKIIQLVCAEMNVPLPEEFSTFGEKGPDMQLNLGQNT